MMATKQEKVAMGYDTSNKRIQQWLDEQKGAIKTKEVDWAKELERAKKFEDRTKKMFREIEPSTPATMFLGLYILGIQHYTTGLVAKMGLDIVKLSEQVTETQKMCKELKLATRGLPED
jgi:hypothetical protein